MQKVEAIINPACLESVRDALAQVGITGMTVLNARGMGRQTGHLKVYRGVEYWENFLPKIKLEILLDDELVDPCVELIAEKARTGQIGDGKIMISPISRIIRIRTGELDNDAL